MLKERFASCCHPPILLHPLLQMPLGWRPGLRLSSLPWGTGRVSACIDLVLLLVEVQFVQVHPCIAAAICYVPL